MQAQFHGPVLEDLMKEAKVGRESRCRCCNYHAHIWWTCVSQAVGIFLAGDCEAPAKVSLGEPGLRVKVSLDGLRRWRQGTRPLVPLLISTRPQSPGVPGAGPYGPPRPLPAARICRWCQPRRCRQAASTLTWLFALARSNPVAVPRFERS